MAWHGALWVGLLLLGSAGAGSAAVPDADSVAHSWTQARIYLPASTLSPAGRAPSWNDAAARIPSGMAFPVVLYLHGCTGIVATNMRDAAMLAEAGFAVILPDSFARPGRVANCDPATHTSSRLFPQAADWRQAEIRYAVERLRELPWVDGRNVFLFGHSEGGVAAARYGGAEFAGHIITGWTCQSSTGRLTGIAAPLATPVLAVVADGDPWYRRPGNQGHCGLHMALRPDAKSLVVRAEAHHVNLRPEVRDEILGFLRRYRR